VADIEQAQQISVEGEDRGAMARSYAAAKTDPPARYAPPMSGRPGDGCDDPRDDHPHWCGTCGAKKLFASVECALLPFVPPCPRCASTDWRGEADELTAPDYREG
jgi:hypothetical protein